MRARIIAGVSVSLCFFLTLAIYLCVFRLLLHGTHAQAQTSPSSTVRHTLGQSLQGPQSADNREPTSLHSQPLQSKDMGRTPEQAAPSDKPCNEDCQMRIADIGRQATLDAARIGRNATWCAVALGIITVVVSAVYYRKQIKTAQDGVAAQIKGAKEAADAQIAAARKATADQIAAAQEATHAQIQAAREATAAQIKRHDDEHKSQAAFDLHREWSTEGMLVTRTRAGKLLSNYPGPISQLEAQGDPDEAARVWVVLNFFMRLQRFIEKDQIDVSLVPDLFGDTFYWWNKRFKEKELDQAGWLSSEVISHLQDWFEKNVPKDRLELWETRAAIDLNNPSRKMAISATSEQREQTLRIHAEMYSTDFFVQVISPTWMVWSRWELLEGAEREKYRRTVVNGLCANAHPFDGAKSDDPCLASRDHFHGVQGFLDRTSEHVALSRFLSFFGNLWEYIDLGLADRDLVVRLFKPMYGWFHPLITKLRKDVEQHPSRHLDLPWIEHTKKLEDIFGLPHEPLLGGIED